MSSVRSGPTSAVRAFALALLAAALGCLTLATAAGAAAKPRPPKITGLRCVPVKAPACSSGVRVAAGDELLVRGSRLARNQRVTFTWSDGQRTGKLTRRAGLGWVVKVPAKTRTGTLRVSIRDRAGRRSNRVKLKVVDAASVALAAPAVGRTPLPPVFADDGMWIFELDKAEGGNPAAIVNRARGAGIETVFVKSADGATSQASQFSPALVAALKAGGLRVCAWQFVYGLNPEGEIAQALESIRAGADCFVINAEKQYAGRYAQAQRYMSAVRAAVGAGYPIGLSSFGIPTSYPNLPYSVFLGPGGADVDLPQVYWEDAKQTPIAFSAAAAKGHRIYGRPIAPMGQTYAGATFDDVQQFRAIWQQYGATGRSWYVWSETTPEVWGALPETPPMLDAEPDPGWQFFQQGSTGDGVLWVQQHLAAFDASVGLDCQFGPGTEAVLRRFQVARGLDSTGGTGPATWQALLKETPVAINWAIRTPC